MSASEFGINKNIISLGQFAFYNYNLLVHNHGECKVEFFPSPHWSMHFFSLCVLVLYYKRRQNQISLDPDVYMVW